MTPEIHPRAVDYYVDGRGREPFREWLDDLKDVSARARIRLRLDRLKLGNFGNFRSVGEGVCELKIDVGPGYRVYFGLTHDVIVLCGGDKSSQESDIHEAKKYWMDYRSRQHANET